MTSKERNILIVPGLNQSPALYKQLLLDFPQITLFQFPCNASDTQEFYNVPFFEYIELLKYHLNENQYRKIYSHSLGSLILFHVLKSKKIDSEIIMIAPAFFSRGFSLVLNYLPGHWSVPSLNRPRWRAHSACKVKHYHQIFKLQKDIDLSLLDNSNVKIIYDPRDELLETKNLSDLKIAQEYFSKSFPRHLCLDFIERDMS